MHKKFRGWTSDFLHRIGFYLSLMIIGTLMSCSLVLECNRLSRKFQQESAGCKETLNLIMR